MKKGGTEVRSNGCEIRQKGYVYYVLIKHDDGTLAASLNGPWDFLRNARADADAGTTGVNSK